MTPYREPSRNALVRLRFAAFLLLLAGPFCVPPSLRGQSIVWGTVDGAVADPTGRPVPRAIVVLRPLGAGGGREVVADAAGRFSFSFLAPGSYELRAEALGYRPAVARPILVAPGEPSSVTVALSPAAPPVISVDTITISSGPASRWRPGGARFTSSDFQFLPDRFHDLTSVASLAPHADRTLGARGLPGSSSLLVADGLPFRRAPHPLARSERLGEPAFPVSSLSGLAVHQTASDVEWGGSAGNYLVVSTPSVASRGATFDVAWSGDPLWSSGRLDLSTPPLVSFRGRARADIEIAPDTSGIALGAEIFQEEMPLAPRVDAALAPTLAGIDTDLIDALSAPSAERVMSYTAFARGDVRRSDTSRLFVRGIVAYTQRDFEGPGPVALGRDAALAEESVDYSVGGGFTSRYRPRLDVEVRAGVSGSDRRFRLAIAGMPPAYLVGSGRAIGNVAGAPGESSRTDVFLTPLVHHRAWGGTLKLGATARFSRFRMHSSVPQELYFSDGPALVAGRGYGRALTAPEASFSTTELGGFAQFTIDPAPRVRLAFGARYNHERLPVSDVQLNAPWLRASGLPNDAFPSSLAQWSAQGTLTWDVFGDGRMRVLSAASVDHGDVDPLALHQALAHDVGATSAVYAGSGLVWPSMALPTGATTLPVVALLGPETRAPRSSNVSVGAVRRFFGDWSILLEAAYRRTDFLIRRRNLNVPIVPQWVDAYGRDVFGTLRQDGALLTASGADARRFPAFHEIWALDPDGWSKYVGASLGLEHAGPGRHFYLVYTRSETTDNWVGAAAGAFGSELLPLLPVAEWDAGTSDFDAKHRLTAAGSFAVGLAAVSGVYRFRSGLPFTPGYRAGVDANGDGSVSNDVAFVDAASVAPLLEDWECLRSQVGAFAARNSCRGPSEHTLDIGLTFRLGTLWGRTASLVVDALDVIETEDGVLDTALLLVDPTGTVTTAGRTVTVPVTANPDFGRVIYPSSRGRMLRIGLRLGS